MPKLTKAEVDEFLQERGHLARIATINADGAPSVVPVWFICENGKILITPRKYSAFYANTHRMTSGVILIVVSRAVISMTSHQTTILPKPSTSRAHSSVLN
jgi:nitroimidazol reductase NimA-like FMN-containing flavoprotein (pyridoxamine 5'-phosphate oxidase superfamily)